MRATGIITMVGATCLFYCGCGTVVTSDFPNRLRGAEGQSVVLEDIEAIVDDQLLNDDEKRSRLRGLGLEDEELIEALLTL